MENSKVTKAIIPVGGYGTRRLPITKAIDKCMLPVCNRPLVDYTVQECICAGVTDIYFVVSPEFTQLQAYYSHSVKLEQYLADRNNIALLQKITTIPDMANFHYIIDDKPEYGTAVPIWLARDVVQDERFIVTFGDNFIYHQSGLPGSDIMELIRQSTAYHTNGAIIGIPMDDQKLSNNGAIRSREHDGRPVLEEIVEKPPVGTAPTNLASISYYLFDTAILPHVERVMQEPNAQGEYYLTDAVNLYAAAGNSLAIVQSDGQFLDGGNLDDWMETNRIIYQAGLGR